jgi:glyoxylase-like metal-dependent hydrolase (beta-lactamase superfamily II)
VHPLLRANTWLVRGRDRDLLVDTGLGVAPIRPVVLDLTGGREPVVVVTHDHLDHLGGAHEFADVWAHPAEAPDRPRGSLHGPTLARLLGLGGEELPEWLLDRGPRADYALDDYVLRPVTPGRALVDGDVVDLGDRTLEVLHLPGHSPGSIALLDRDAATLFSGDVVYDDEPLDDLAGGDPTAYADSMRRLLGLDVRLVHAGHDDDLSAARMREVAEGYLRRRHSR